MQVVLNFQITEKVRPVNGEHCLFILKSHPENVNSATYDTKEDAFYVDDVWSYPASDVLYWTKAST